MQGSKSLPKKSSALNYGLLLGQIQLKRQQRKNKSVDGSVSDSNYTSYSDIQSMRGPGGRAGHYGGGWASCQEEAALGSNESLDSVSSSIKQARAHSLNRPKVIIFYPSSTTYKISSFSPLLNLIISPQLGHLILISMLQGKQQETGVLRAGGLWRKKSCCVEGRQ